MARVPVNSLAVCTDGKSVTEFEKEGAKKSGLSVEEWRKAVQKSLADASEESIADAFAEGEGAPYAKQAKKLAERFHSVAAGMESMKWDSPDKLQDLLEGKVDGLEALGEDMTGYNRYKRPMWSYLKKQGLVVDRNWQHTTAVSWVGPGGRRLYGSNMTPYVVRRSNTDYDWSKGSIIKLVDAGNPSSVAYAQVLGSGPSGESKLELSQGAYKLLGYDADGKSTPAGLKGVDYSLAATGGMDGNVQSMLSSDEIQLAGALGDQGLLSVSGKAIRHDDITRSVAALDDKKLAKLDKSLNEGARRELAKQQKAIADKKAGKTADASSSAGTNKLLRGFPTVFAGETLRAVGYACADCIHDGGGHVTEGSATVYVGPFPLSRVGDATSDAKAVTTGNESVYVGGPTATA